MKKQIVVLIMSICLVIGGTVVSANQVLAEEGGGGECQNTVIDEAKNRFFSLSGCKGSKNDTCVIRCPRDIKIGLKLI